MSFTDFVDPKNIRITGKIVIFTAYLWTKRVFSGYFDFWQEYVA